MIAAGRLIRLLSRVILDERQRKTVNFFSRYVIKDEDVAKDKSSISVIDRLDDGDKDIKHLYEKLDLECN